MRKTEILLFGMTWMDLEGIMLSGISQVEQYKSILLIMHACMLSCFSRVGLFATLWTVSHQAPLSMGFLQAKYWSGLTCLPPGDLPNQGTEPTSLKSLATNTGFFTH